MAKERILVVEDDEDILQLLRFTLEAAGFEVVTAATGRDGLESAQRHVPGLVLLDLMLPGMSGFDVCRELKRTPATEHVPVIMLTAFGRDDLVEMLGATTVDAVLEKPVTPSSLLDALMTALHIGGPSVAPAAVTAAPAKAAIPPLAGHHLLLVEDNAINQLVATELLEALGAKVSVAGDGQAALERLAHPHDFAAVLMDVQMPGMDGFEATGRIRDDLGLTDLPIIAMTAHAMERDRQRCLAAGMNDHLAKPIDLAEMTRVLSRWVSASASAPDPAPAAAPAAVAAGQADAELPEQVPGLDLAVARRNLNHNDRLLLRLLADFSATLVPQVHRLPDILAAEGWGGVAATAHTLKGTAATLGAVVLADVAGRLEALARGRAPDTVMADALMIDAIAAADTVQTGIRQVIPTVHPAALAEGGQRSPEAVEARLAALRDQLCRFDPAAGETATQLAALLTGTAAEAAARRLARLAEDFDFEDALAALDDVAARAAG